MLNSHNCTVCGNPIRVQIFRGSGTCGELCRKSADSKKKRRSRKKS